MGVTIHYSGSIEPKKIPLLVDFLTRISERYGFEYKPVDSRHAKGILVVVNPDCDPLRFVFDRAGQFTHFTKTQFAGLEAHIETLGVLKIVNENFIPNLNVEDETGYWDTNDFEKLRKDFTDIAVGLDEIAEKLEEKKINAGG